MAFHSFDDIRYRVTPGVESFIILAEDGVNLEVKEATQGDRTEGSQDVGYEVFPGYTFSFGEAVVLRDFLFFFFGSDPVVKVVVTVVVQVVTDGGSEMEIGLVLEYANVVEKGSRHVSVTAIPPKCFPTSGVVESRFPGAQRVKSDVLGVVSVVRGFLGFVFGFVQDMSAVRPLELGDEPVPFAGWSSLVFEVRANLVELRLGHFARWTPEIF